MLRIKLYTGRGDHGNTNLIGGKTVKKTDLRVKAYGEIDELNAHIGMLITMLPDSSEVFMLTGEKLTQIQHTLFDIGSILADKFNKMNITVPQKKVEALEKVIDAYDSGLPELEYFVLPGGSTLGAQSHIARTVARRVERSVLDLHEEEPVDKNALVYLNRLSDLLFVMARYFNSVSGHKDVYYMNTGKVFHN